MNKRVRSMNKSKWADRDSSLLVENRGSFAAFESNLTDNEEKLRMNTPSLTDQSMHELFKKRHNSTERSSKGFRPKSSKGVRGYNTQSSSQTNIPRLP